MPPPSPQDHQSLLELSPLHSFHVTRPSCPSFSPPLGHVPCLRVSVHVCDARHVRWPCGVKGVRLKVGVEGVHGVRGVCCLVSMVSMAIGATTLICHACASQNARTHSCIHSAYTHSCMSCLWCPGLVSIHSSAHIPLLYIMLVMPMAPILEFRIPSVCGPSGCGVCGMSGVRGVCL